jgi:hypothetical protein
MFEDIAEVVLGPLGLALAAAVMIPDGRKLLRKAAKVAIHAGLTASDYFQEALSEAKESTEKLIEEIKSESEDGAKNHKHKKVAKKA